MRTSQGAQLRLHRILLTRDHGTAWLSGDEPVLPGMLEVRLDDRSHLLACPDTVTLVTSLWHQRPFGARGQMLRPVRDEHGLLRLETASSAGTQLLATFEERAWYSQLARLAGQVGDVLAAADERSLMGLLAPVLAGVPSAGL